MTIAVGWVSALARARRKNARAEARSRRSRSNYVDHLALLIDGAVEVPRDGAMEDEDLVDVPAAAKPTTMPPGRWKRG